MNNISNSEWIKKNTSVQCNGMRHTKLFHAETSSLAANESRNRQPNFNSSHLKGMNQFFKAPNFDNIPVRKASVKSILSPRRRVQTGRIKNDSKINQKMKMSFLPHPNFINPRKSLMCPRGNKMNNINSRKEVIKKMVLLAECSPSEKTIFMQSTPVKLLTGLTPRKTPRSQGYLVMPEFKKMGLKVDMGTPIQDLVKEKLTTSDLKNNLNKDNKSNDSKVDLECFTLDKTAVFHQILQNCRTYNKEFNFVYGRLKTLEDLFESKVKNMPDYLVYDEFCHYQFEKEKLYNEFKLVEKKFKNSVKNQTHIGKMLKNYLKERGELFEKQTALHNKFETVVELLWEKSKMQQEEKKEKSKENRKNEKEEIKKNETPKLRRSLRLSKKNKHEEITPLTKKLKRLDSKSKIIQKGKVRLG